MDLSGMIFVALAVVWAVYLIPRAVNRSEDELALMPAGWGEESPQAESEQPAESAESPVTSAVAAPAAPVAAARPTELRPMTAGERAGVRRAVARRRRVLLTLLAMTAVAGALSAFAVLPVWATAVPGALVATWLVVCRTQVRRLEARRAERLTIPVEQPAAPAEIDRTPASVQVEQPEQVEVAAPSLREFRIDVPDSPAALVVEPDEDTVGLTEADRAAAVADEMPRGAVWDPRPLTLPTYISKPRARRAPRTLALDGAGVSSSGRDARDSALVAQGAYAGVDATAQPRQAVGS